MARSISRQAPGRSARCSSRPPPAGSAPARTHQPGHARTPLGLERANGTAIAPLRRRGRQGHL